MWVKSQSSDSVKPSEIDKTSSKNVVYVRKDFREVEIENGIDGEKRTVWEYLENKIPKKDWETYESLIETKATVDVNTANIDYISMMVDIELPTMEV